MRSRIQSTGPPEALQSGNRKTWSALFEPDAELYDDESPRSLKEFTRDALGHERFTSIDRVENNGLDLTGAFHSERWGAVTAEVASSSLVVPAIPSKALALILAKPSRTQKGTFLCPFLCPFSPGQFPSSVVLTLQRDPIQTVVTLRSLRTKTPTTRPLPELHVWRA